MTEEARAGDETTGQPESAAGQAGATAQGAQNSRRKRENGKPYGRPFVRGRSGNPGGRPKSALELKNFARSVIEDPEYQAAILRQARKGKLHHAVQGLLMAYAYGKPVEKIELRDMRPVEILMERIEAVSSEGLEVLAPSPLTRALPSGNGTNGHANGHGTNGHGTNGHGE